MGVKLCSGVVVDGLNAWLYDELNPRYDLYVNIKILMLSGVRVVG